MNKWAVTAATGTSLAGSSAGAYALGAFDGALSSSSPIDPIIQNIDKKNGCVQKIFSNVNIELIKNDRAASDPKTLTLAFTSSTPVNSCLLAVVKKTEPNAQGQSWKVYSLLWSLKRGQDDGFVAKFTVDETQKKSQSTVYLLNKSTNNPWVTVQKETQINNNLSQLPRLNSNLIGNGESGLSSAEYSTVYVEWKANKNGENDLKNWSSDFTSWISTLFSSQAWSIIDSITSNAYKGSWNPATMPS